MTTFKPYFQVQTGILFSHYPAWSSMPFGITSHDEKMERKVLLGDFFSKSQHKTQKPKYMKTPDS
jgi:hypothetical protein